MRAEMVKEMREMTGLETRREKRRQHCESVYDEASTKKLISQQSQRQKLNDEYPMTVSHSKANSKKSSK